MNIQKKVALTLAAGMLLIGAGCSTHVSRDITSDGKAGEVIFPNTDRLVLKEGTFPTVEALRQIGPGVTKDQLYQLIGRPHFHEGFAGVREWDYLFHFRKGGQVTTCQYKVIFDDAHHGQSFHWLPAECAKVMDEAVAVAEPRVEKRFEVSADALFAFGRSGLNDILAAGKLDLANIAVQLKDADVERVTVVGHTDRIGSDASNMELSQRRAETVRQYLASLGVNTPINADGKGESSPVVSCEDSLGRAQLIACLQPNRRVEIIASGKR